MLCAPKYLEVKVVGKNSTERRNKMGKLMSALFGIAAMNSVAFAGKGDKASRAATVPAVVRG